MSLTKFDNLKNLHASRKTGFFKQFSILLSRLLTSFIKAPLFIWAIFGNAFFMTILVSSVYYKTGQFALNFDIDNN
jgi:hypothetical protein